MYIRINLITDWVKYFCKFKSSTHVLIKEWHCSGLGRDSVALCEQILPLNRKDIVECVGEVDKKMMKKITKAVQIQVGVYEEYN